MKTVFHWNPFVIFNHRITLEEVWLMQFKFSPDKLNYSSWRRLRQKTKQSSQSVSQSVTSPRSYRTSLRRGSHVLQHHGVKSWSLQAQQPGGPRTSSLSPLLPPTFCFAKQRRTLGRPTDKKCCSLQGRWQKQSWGLYLHLERAVCSLLVALTGRTKESEKLLTWNWMQTLPIASHYFICQWWDLREWPVVVSGEV